MKNTILAVLMLLVITIPCFAQELETDEFFSLHGTQWEVTQIGANEPEHYTLSFYRGQVYHCNSFCIQYVPHFYFDLIGVSLFQMGQRKPQFFDCDTYSLYIGLISPLFESSVMYHEHQYCRYPMTVRKYVATLTKINDNWTPPEIE